MDRAGNTPFRRWKRETYGGGACDPFLVSWPKGIKARGEIRGQYAHIIDMVPTVLEVLGVEPPATIRGVTQAPIHGVSFAHTFDNPAAPTRHRTQYFEMFGHRSIDHDGWRAVCPWPGPSFAEAGKPFGAPITAETLTDLDAHHWELYHVADDPAENHDLAAEHRDKLIEMIAQWYVEAGKYNVLPIDGSAVQRLMTERPQIAEARNRYTLPAGTQTVPFFAGPRLLDRRHAITADVDIPPGGAEGVLLCQGSGVGGWSFYLKEGGSRTTSTTMSAAPSTRSHRLMPCPPDGMSCASSSSPPENQTSARARAHPGWAQLSTSTASWWGRPISRSPRPSSSTQVA